jgi:hypothetical protein
MATGLSGLVACAAPFYPSTLGAIIASLMLNKKSGLLSRRWNFDTILRLALLGCLIVGSVGATLAIIHVVADPNPAAERTEPPPRQAVGTGRMSR